MGYIRNKTVKHKLIIKSIINPKIFYEIQTNSKH